MDRAELIETLLSLANGKHPFTGQPFEEESPYQDIRITRVLFQAVREIEHILFMSSSKSCQNHETIETKTNSNQDEIDTIDSKNKIKCESTGLDINSLNEPDLQLYEKLRIWRTEECKEQCIPAYIVMSNKALMQIAFLKPENIDELLAANGVGTAKADKYGEQILNIISQHKFELSEESEISKDEVPF